MIHVKTDGPSGPTYDAWHAKAKTQRDKVLAYWDAHKGSAETPRVWREAGAQGIWNELKMVFLHATFRYKCAYCEGKYGAGHPWHVEHYRPKSEVTEDRELIDHPGYFWLAHEWYNLLLCCGHCNTWEEKSQKTGGKSDPSKSNEFRIRGHRVAAPGPDAALWRDELKQERPLLLNPYDEEGIEKHFGFQEDGQIYGKTEEGKETVRVCNLHRVGLAEARRQRKSDVYCAIHEQLHRAKEGQGPPEEYFGPEEEYSAWKNYWANIMISRLRARGKPPPGPNPTSSPTPGAAGPREWPKTMIGQVRAALAVLAAHPEGLTAEQLARSFRRARGVRALDVLDVLIEVGKVRGDGTGRYIAK
jgi:hypothetical protein